MMESNLLIWKIFEMLTHKTAILRNIFLHDTLYSYIVFIVSTFDTKVTEYLCSGWVFFSSDKFRLFN